MSRGNIGAVHSTVSYFPPPSFTVILNDEHDNRQSTIQLPINFTRWYDF